MQILLTTIPNCVKYAVLIFQFTFLGHQDEFHYLNQGENPFIDAVDDLSTFEDTMNALTVLGFSKSEQFNMFKILAGVLHLGNVRFSDIDLSGDHSREDSEGCGILVSSIH